MSPIRADKTCFKQQSNDNDNGLLFSNDEHNHRENGRFVGYRTLRFGFNSSELVSLLLVHGQGNMEITGKVGNLLTV